MVAIARVRLEIRAHSAQIRKDLKKMQALTDRHFKQMRRRAMRTFAGVGLVFDVSRLLRGLGTAISGWGKYEAALSNVQAKTNALKSDLGPLRKEIEQIAETTKFTLKETADAAGFLAMAGLELDQIVNAIKPSLDIAAATGTTADVAADIVTNIATPLKLLNDDLLRVADVVALTTASANVSIEELGQSFSYAASVMPGLNTSLEEGAALIGILGNAGIKGSRAGIFMRQAFVAMSKGVEIAGDSFDSAEESLSNQSRTLAKYGVRMKEADGTVRNFLTVLTELHTAGATAGDYIKIFGARAGAVIQSLLAQGIPTINQLRDSLEEAGGSASRMSEIQLDNLTGDLLIFRSNWEILTTRFAESGIGDYIRKITQRLTDMLVSLRPIAAVIGHNLPIVLDHLKNAFDFLWPILETLFPGLVVIIGVTLVAKIAGLIIWLGKLVKALIAVAVANPWIASIAGLTILTTLAMKYSNELGAYWDTIVEGMALWMRSARENMKNLWSGVINWVKDKFNAWLDWLISVYGWLNTFLPEWMQVDTVRLFDDKAKINAGRPGTEDKAGTEFEEWSFEAALTKNLEAIQGNDSALDALLAKGRTVMAKLAAMMGFSMPGAIGGGEGEGEEAPVEEGATEGEGEEAPAEKGRKGILGMFDALAKKGDETGGIISNAFKQSIEDTMDYYAKGTKVTGEMIADLANLAINASGKMAKAAKLVAVAQTLWNVYEGVSRAFKDHPYPKSAVVAAIVLAKGLLQVRHIKSTNVGQAHAGMTDVPETGSYMLERGERVVDKDLNVDLKGFLSGHSRPMQAVKNVYLQARGMYSGDDLEMAFAGEPGLVILQSEFR